MLITLKSVGLVVASVPWTAAACESETLPKDRPNPGAHATAPDEGPFHEQSPIACRIVRVGNTQQRALLEQVTPFRWRPELLTPTVLQNPLIADDVEIEFENRSGSDLELFAEHGVDRPFWTQALIRDQEGETVTFTVRASAITSLARSSSCPPDTPTLRLKAGQVVKQRLSLWHGLIPEDDLKPGRYTVRVRCSSFLAPDGEDFHIESEPFEISITEADLREWSDLQDVIGSMPVPIVEP